MDACSRNRLPWPEVYCVIRTFNEERYLARCLETLAAQTDCPPIKVIIIDSGSTDSTLAIAKAYPGVTLAHAERSELHSFDFAKALNQGIRLATSELVAILSAHAIPAGVNWMSSLLRWFDDERVVGVYGRQLPWPDADPLEEARLHKTFGSETAVFNAGDALDKLAFSNAASVIRRAVWQEIPFRLPSAEDLQWAKDVLQMNHKIVYDSAAIVYHSHSDRPAARAHRRISFALSRNITNQATRTRATVAKDGFVLFVRDTLRYFRLCRSPRRLVSSIFYSAAVAYYFIRDFPLHSRR